MLKKALLIARVLYPKYSLLFNNVTSYSIYVKDTLQVKDINKNIRDK